MPKTATKPAPTATPAKTPRKMTRRADTAKESGPRSIDVHVGGRIRLRRTLMGMSQEKLGEKIGLTFQQVQKYERGANRVSASRLFDLSKVLDVPISFFFDDMPPEEGVQGGLTPESTNALTRRRNLELVRNFDAIEDSDLQDSIYELVKTAARNRATADADAA